MKIPLPSGRSLLRTLPVLATLLVAAGGCGKKADSDGPPPGTAVATSAPAEQVLRSWQRGDQARALEQFVQTDWKTVSAFSPGSPLNDRETDLPAMSAAQRDRLLRGVSAQLEDLKALAKAVRDKGQSLASTNPELARQYFTRLDEFGAALAQPDRLKLVQLVGQAFRKMASTETARLGRISGAESRSP